MSLVACDDDEFSYVWADKVHAVSPSRAYVAYVQEEKSSSEVLISFHQNGCCAVAVQFPGTHLPLKLQWLDPTTLEIRYPKGTSPDCADARDHDIVDCFGPKVRTVLVQI